MRVNEGEDNFANYLLLIGNGTAGENITLPNNIKGEGDVVKFVYGNIQNSIAEGLLTELTILAPTNDDCSQLNQKVLSLLDSEERVYLSIDKVLSDDINKHLRLRTEFLNKIEGSGLPRHRLPLKVNAVILLMRNMNTAKGLINGTRLKIK
ncbi:uncharacterized protein [Diabrotica undecimpunctata]|uniref:uncharacterized protein n=1 Tax=Diabrotica undecimpunctata TaxID=50387 RepID=UPI003B6344EC